MIRGPLRGYGTPINQLIVPEVFGHNPDLEPIRQDQREARRLLVEAGWGEGLAATLDYPSDKYRNLPGIAEHLEADLSRIGIELTARAQPFSRLFGRLKGGRSEAFLIGWMTPFHAGKSYNYLVGSGNPEFDRDNLFAYSQPRIDDLIQAHNLTLVPARRTRLLQQITEQLRRDLPFVSLYRQDDLYAVSRGLDFRPRMDRRIVGFELRWH
jgi:peptide/nickel transport system substrate-binding protein